MPVDERLTVLSLCSGIGGIDVGLERAGMRVVGQCEIDKYCRTVLERHWPDVPFIPDIRDVNASFGTPDVVAAGFPCQPVSQAGKRLGQEDPRWLWPQVARVVRELRPRVVFLENVPGLIRKGFTDVLTDLAEAGFDAVWGSLRASDVGAPHRRERIFVVATPTDASSAGHGENAGRALGDESGSPGWSAHADHIARRVSPSGIRAAEQAAADADDGRRKQRDPEVGGVPFPGAIGEPAFQWGDYADAIARWEYARGDTAPEPVDESGRLMPEFIEWMMGYEVGWTEGNSKTQRIKQLGNSVVPQCVEVVGALVTGRAS